MALPDTGEISLNDIKNEFDGTTTLFSATPVKMSDYYRQGSKVKQGLKNKDVPTSGEISLSDFYCASRTTLVTITVVGGGGAGGAGNDDGHHWHWGVRANSGGATVVKERDSPHTEYLRAVGGQGGYHYKLQNASSGTSGSNSNYTRNGGGAGRGERQSGGDATPSSYGAGGGGAGGDKSGWFRDDYGHAGEGGSAGESIISDPRKEIAYGNILDISIGDGGKGDAPNCGSPHWKGRGGNGAPGYCKLEYDGNEEPFTSSDTYTVGLKS